MEGGNAGVLEKQHREQGPLNTGRRCPPQRNVEGEGGGQIGRRAPSGDQRRRPSNFVGHAAGKADPVGVGVCGGAWEVTGAGAVPKAREAGPVPSCCNVCKEKAISMARLVSTQDPSASGPPVIPVMPQCGEPEPRSVHSGPFLGRRQF